MSITKISLCHATMLFALVAGVTLGPVTACAQNASATKRDQAERTTHEVDQLLEQTLTHYEKEFSRVTPEQLGKLEEASESASRWSKVIYDDPVEPRKLPEPLNTFEGNAHYWDNVAHYYCNKRDYAGAINAMKAAAAWRAKFDRCRVSFSECLSK